MIDFKLVDGELVPLNEVEIAERDAREQAWKDSAIDRALASIRIQRNTLLEESDVYVLPDRWESYSSEKKQAWSDYRQSLRDLPNNIIDPLNPIWPVKPA